MTTPCPRCGAPVKGTGKTGMCHVCASSVSRKSKIGRSVLEEGARHRAHKHRYRKPAPVTLATKA